ncbi:hypothetical protein PF010_g32491 [Phytophthora fragariae]|uniref:Uncharacterized protein n=1 Tax=Phytophthora fragariae TaxID=53985 RepID=A0A6G0M6W2_9STRA|nr:hypothetical protein PF010_g32491 [Phytophthora fragariae]KAE9157476.1 hypothetical protein PF004_g32204 [Phytophthora fragariae]
MSVAAAATVVIAAFPSWSWVVSDAARLANGALGPETTEARSRHVTRPSENDVAVTFWGTGRINYSADRTRWQPLIVVSANLSNYALAAFETVAAPPRSACSP